MELTRLNSNQFKELASSKHWFKKGCLSLLVIFLGSCGGENVKPEDPIIVTPSDPINEIDEPTEKKQAPETKLEEASSLSIELLPKAVFMSMI